MSEPRRDKRWRREHRAKPAADLQRAYATAPNGDRIEVVYYSPTTTDEAVRRIARANALNGTPFVRLPAAIDDDQAVAFTCKDGTPIPFEAVEMVFNDSLLLDAISNWGQDGPLYRDTIDGLQREVYDFAVTAYKDVPLPEAYRRPN